MKLWEIGKLLHGGDYNVDQWLDRPDILAEDIRLMKLAGVNVVSLCIFFLEQSRTGRGSVYL